MADDDDEFVDEPWPSARGSRPELRTVAAEPRVPAAAAASGAPDPFDLVLVDDDDDDTFGDALHAHSDSPSGASEEPQGVGDRKLTTSDIPSSSSFLSGPTGAAADGGGAARAAAAPAAAAPATAFPPASARATPAANALAAATRDFASGEGSSDDSGAFVDLGERVITRATVAPAEAPQPASARATPAATALAALTRDFASGDDASDGSDEFSLGEGASGGTPAAAGARSAPHPAPTPPASRLGAPKASSSLSSLQMLSGLSPIEPRPTGQPASPPASSAAPTPHTAAATRRPAEHQPGPAPAQPAAAAAPRPNTVGARGAVGAAAGAGAGSEAFAEPAAEVADWDEEPGAPPTAATVSAVGGGGARASEAARVAKQLHFSPQPAARPQPTQHLPAPSALPRAVADDGFARQPPPPSHAPHGGEGGERPARSARVPDARSSQPPARADAGAQTEVTLIRPSMWRGWSSTAHGAPAAGWGGGAGRGAGGGGWGVASQPDFSQSWHGIGVPSGAGRATPGPLFSAASAPRLGSAHGARGAPRAAPSTARLAQGLGAMYGHGRAGRPVDVHVGRVGVLHAHVPVARRAVGAAAADAFTARASHAGSGAELAGSSGRGAAQASAHGPWRSKRAWGQSERPDGWGRAWAEAAESQLRVPSWERPASHLQPPSAFVPRAAARGTPPAGLDAGASLSWGRMHSGSRAALRAAEPEAAAGAVRWGRSRAFHQHAGRDATPPGATYARGWGQGAGGTSAPAAHQRRTSAWPGGRHEVGSTQEWNSAEYWRGRYFAEVARRYRAV